MPDKEPIEIPVKKQTTDEKLDEIIRYLHHIDRRDRMRMIGSSFHSIIWAVSTVAVLYGIWYFTTHTPQIIEAMTKQMVQQSIGGGSTSSSGGWMEQLQKYMGR